MTSAQTRLIIEVSAQSMGLPFEFHSKLVKSSDSFGFQTKQCQCFCFHFPLMKAKVSAEMLGESDDSHCWIIKQVLHAYSVTDSVTISVENTHIL